MTDESYEEQCWQLVKFLWPVFLIWPVLLAMSSMSRKPKGAGAANALHSDSATVGQASSCVGSTPVSILDQLMHLDGVIIREQKAVPHVPDKANTLILIIPGNPGVPDFYVPYITALHQLSARRWEVCCLSHTGHSPRLANGELLYSLDDQIRHKLSYVKYRLKENPHLKFVLVGHSVGAHICLQILSQFPEHVEKVILLQPTIMHIGKSRSGEKFRKLGKAHHRAIALMAGILSLLPEFIKRVLVGLWVKEQQLAAAAIELLDRWVVHNILHMAHHEMLELTDLDEELVHCHQEKMLFLFAKGDHWVPEEYSAYLAERFDKAKCVESKNWLHAFMLEASGSDAMAKLSWWWISHSKTDDSAALVKASS